MTHTTLTEEANRIVSIRKGVKEDLPEVVAMIKELADYENALDEVEISVEQLERDGFGAHPYYWL